MAPYATDLVPNDPLSGSDDVARYCKPTSLKDKQVTLLSFMKDENPGRDISVNWIQFYQDCSQSEAIEFIVQEMRAYPFGISVDGVYAILNVAWIVSIADAMNIPIKILYTPMPALPPKAALPSHCSIIVPDEDALHMIASEIAMKINSEHLRCVPR